MSGELKDDMVIVKEQKEGSTLYNKGNYGYPISGGGVNLDLLEATYLMESKRLEVVRDGSDVSFEQMFIHSSNVHDDFDIRYMVYRDIRQRGFVIKNESDDFDFSVFPRGKTISNSRPQYLVKAVSERTSSSITDFLNNIDMTQSKGKQLLYGVVDEEGDLTYYLVSSKDMTGKIEFTANGKINGKLIQDRVFIFDTDDASGIYDNGFFGKPVEGMLQLSLIESCYLMNKGMLNVTSSDGDVSEKELIEFGRRMQNEFDIRHRAYGDMRDRGLLVKTGFKYGTHFRVYEDHPDKCHARYLVHSVESDKEMSWPEISRTVRLAHGVKKEILFTDHSGRYMELKRFRP